MKKYIVLALFFIPILLLAQNVDKQTFVYSVKGNDTLRLDKYDNHLIVKEKPCVIFMFGGGFVHGERDSKQYIPYFNSLVEKGYIVCSIDYRLGLKDMGSKMTDPNDLMAFINLLNNTISIAVEDLYDATNYILDNAGRWNVDKDLLIINGSSAGAVSVLQAEYEICNNTKLAQKLPSGFNYAGVISFAGAIFNMQGDLSWKSKPAPMILFHGDADSNVPYDKLEMYPIGFYGSKHIAEQLNQMKRPYCFFDFENAAHEIAGNPMSQYVEEIISFTDKIIIKKQPLMIHSKIEQVGKPVLNKNIELLDYLKSNYMSM